MISVPGRTGFGISAAVYTDTRVAIKSEQEVTADHHPFVEALTFGDYCSPDLSQALFSKVLVKVAQTGAHNLVVEME